MSEYSTEANEIKIASPQTHRFTSDEVQKMYEHGILPENERLELIDGQLYVVSPKNPPQVVVQRKLMGFCNSHLTETNYLIDKEIPLDVSQKTMPEPDFIIARQRPELWKDEHVKVSDVLLLVEVTDSTVQYDLSTKKELYEQGGIPVYWVINLPQRQVHVFSDWRDGQYQITTVYKEGPVPLPLSKLSISFTDIFPDS